MLVFQSLFKKSVATIIAKRNLNCSSAVFLYHTCPGFILDNTFLVLHLQELPRSFLFWDPFDQSQPATIGRHFPAAIYCHPKERKHGITLKKVNVSLSKLSIILIPMVFVDIWIEKDTPINFTRGKVKAQMLSEYRDNTEIMNGWSTGILLYLGGPT